MSGKIASLICILFTIISLCFALTTAKVSAQSQNLLTLEISSPQREYLQSEPIQLNLKLSNHATTSVVWNSNLEFGEDLDFVVSKEGETEILHKNHLIETPLTNTRTTASERSVSKQNMVNDYLSEKLFPSPGRYRLKINLKYLDFSTNEERTITIASNNLEFNIIAPTGANGQAYNFLRQVYQPVNDSGEFSEIVQKRKYFYENFRNTVYWKYMTYRLGNTYLLLKKFPEAEQAFYDISDIDFIFAREVEEQLRNLAGKFGRPVPRSKRPQAVVNPPVAIPIPAPTIINGPFPSNPPVLIPIPNPVVNPSPIPTPIGTPITVNCIVESVQPMGDSPVAAYDTH